MKRWELWGLLLWVIIIGVTVGFKVREMVWVDTKEKVSSVSSQYKGDNYDDLSSRLYPAEKEEDCFTVTKSGDFIPCDKKEENDLLTLEAYGLGVKDFHENSMIEGTNDRLTGEPLSHSPTQVEYVPDTPTEFLISDSSITARQSNFLMIESPIIDTDYIITLADFYQMNEDQLIRLGIVLAVCQLNQFEDVMPECIYTFETLLPEFVPAQKEDTIFYYYQRFG